MMMWKDINVSENVVVKRLYNNERKKKKKELFKVELYLRYHM